MFFRSSHREAKERTHFTDQTGDSFEPPCNTSTITSQKATELKNAHVTNLET